MQKEYRMARLWLAMKFNNRERAEQKLEDLKSLMQKFYDFMVDINSNDETKDLYRHEVPLEFIKNYPFIQECLYIPEKATHIERIDIPSFYQIDDIQSTYGTHPEIVCAKIEYSGWVDDVLQHLIEKILMCEEYFYQEADNIEEDVFFPEVLSAIIKEREYERELKLLRERVKALSDENKMMKSFMEGGK